jgi:predicted signal transduction protein with EAL and GGDEF domain
MLIYMVCIMVSLLPLSTPGSRTTGAGVATAAWQRFRATAAARLDRARDGNETGWALLRIELDDAEDLERAGGISVFHRLVRDMTARVREVFPADADVTASPDGAIIVLVARPEAVVRELVRESLRAIAVRDPAAPVTVTPSASIGWASVQVSGYDLDTLLAVTSAAAERARSTGGDRWERVSD